MKCTDTLSLLCDQARVTASKIDAATWVSLQNLGDLLIKCQKQTDAVLEVSSQYWGSVS